MLVVIVAAACWRTGDASPFVLLVCFDGATPGVIDELRSANRLPIFEKLIRSGIYGPLRSLPARRLMNENTRRGFHSPILWTSIATGKVPEKHGVRDFVLPVRGTSKVWMGSEESPPRATLTLPDLSGRRPLTLQLRLHSYVPNGEQSVQVLLNEKLLQSISVPVKWEDFSIPIPDEVLRPVRNELVLVFSRQSRPAEQGDSKDRRQLACELATLKVVDGRGREVLSLDPVHQRFSLGRGFYLPRGQVTEIQSTHWRAMPYWSLLGDLGHPVGIVGHWGTFPAREVNGFLVSSRMGMKHKRQSRAELTWPPELAAQLLPLAPDFREVDQILERLHLSDCDPPLLKDKTGVPKILLQDEYYSRIARELLPTMERGLFSVYFRGIDVVSHVTLHWRHGAPLWEGCAPSVRAAVDETYMQMDRRLGQLLERKPRNAVVLVVSDHGEQPISGGGHHAPYGIFVAAGPGIREGATLSGASVLDVAPTLLHMFGVPIPLDMDGKLLPQIFEASWLETHPPRYADIDTSLSIDEEAITEGREEMLEQLKALGYIQ